MPNTLPSTMNRHFDEKGNHRNLRMSSLAEVNTEAALTEHSFRYRLLQERQSELAAKGIERTLKEIGMEIGGEFARTAYELNLK